MANGGQGAAGSWTVPSFSETFPRTGSEEGMRYLEGVDWSEIWKTMTIKDDDVFDDETGAEEEQTRTMVIMGYDCGDDNDNKHNEYETENNGERKIIRKSDVIQRPQSERYSRRIGEHRQTRTNLSVNPQQNDESRGENYRATRTRSSVIPRQYDESRGTNYRTTPAYSSVTPQENYESRGENYRATRTNSSVIPQQNYENRGDKYRPTTTRTHSSIIRKQNAEIRGTNYRKTRPHSYVVPQQNDENGGTNYRPILTQSSVIPQQNDKSRGESYRSTRIHSSIIRKHNDESRVRNCRPTRAHSTVILQQNDAIGEINFRPILGKSSAIPQQNEESHKENYRATPSQSFVFPQQFYESRAENYRPMLLTQSSVVIPQQNDESHGDNYRALRTHSSVIPQQNDESRGTDCRPTRTRWSVIQQQYDECRGTNSRLARSHSAFIPQQYDESRGTSSRPTRTRWTVIPQQFERRGRNRSPSLQTATGGLLRETNWQRSETTDTRERRDKSRRTEDIIVNFHNDDNPLWRQNSVFTCKVCFSERVLEPRFCCSFPICHSCFDKYLTTQIDDGKATINCPNYECGSAVPFEEVAQTVDSDRRIKLERLASKTLRKKGYKACPQCNAITVASETLLRKAKLEKSTFKVTCPVCQLEWCYDCETPWHRNSTCKNVKSNDKLFKEWTKRYSDSEKSEKNARKCPKCKVGIGNKCPPSLKS